MAHFTIQSGKAPEFSKRITALETLQGQIREMLTNRRKELLRRLPTDAHFMLDIKETPKSMALFVSCAVEGRSIITVKFYWKEDGYGSYIAFLENGLLFPILLPTPVSINHVGVGPAAEAYYTWLLTHFPIIKPAAPKYDPNKIYLVMNRTALKVKMLSQISSTAWKWNDVFPPSEEIFGFLFRGVNPQKMVDAAFESTEHELIILDNVQAMIHWLYMNRDRIQ